MCLSRWCGRYLFSRAGLNPVLCPYCNHDESKVIDSRDSGDGIRRRRECTRCSLRFTTYERVQSRTLAIVKRDERREEFDREKLWNSLMKACAKRPLPVGTVEKVMEEIEAQLAEIGRTEIPSRFVGEMVMEKLRNVDRVAYIRYASVYRDFRDIETFKEEIDALLEPAEAATEPSNQLSFLEEEQLPQAPRRRRQGPRRQAPPPV